MGRWHPLLLSTSGKVGLAVFLLGITVIIYGVSSLTASTDLASLSRQGLFIDAATGKTFQYIIQTGDKVPVLAPSGQRTGYPAEYCYWTREGTPREEPFPVLLSTYLGQPGPTFCPDCDRLVKPRSSPPLTEQPAPPTREEYAHRMKMRSERE